jgi:hypothetical protein
VSEIELCLLVSKKGKPEGSCAIRNSCSVINKTVTAKPFEWRCAGAVADDKESSCKAMQASCMAEGIDDRRGSRLGKHDDGLQVAALSATIKPKGCP